MLDAYVLVDKPRGHFPSNDLLLDRLGPRPRLLVGHQRHRRKRARPVTHLTAILQDRRYILSKGDLILRCQRIGRRRLARHRRDRYDYGHATRCRKDEAGLREVSVFCNGSHAATSSTHLISRSCGASYTRRPAPHNTLLI